MNPLMIFGRALMLERNRMYHIGLRELCGIAA